MALATGNGILEDEFPADLQFNSPSVGILCERFPVAGKCRILDLGAPCESNVAFFARGSCRIYVEDLFRYFIAPGEKLEGVGEEQDVSSALSKALGFEDSARFDLVLGWDLFSYMEPRAVELLMKRIARSCRAGTLLFLTLPTDEVIPNMPARISMTRHGDLRYQKPVQSRSISNPRLSPTALQNMMPGFHLLHSFLLRERMQEFLFGFA
jgi:hypothetical protein